jgi:hypothetical protein
MYFHLTTPGVKATRTNVSVFLCKINATLLEESGGKPSVIFKPAPNAIYFILRSCRLLMLSATNTKDWGRHMSAMFVLPVPAE